MQSTIDAFETLWKRREQLTVRRQTLQSHLDEQTKRLNCLTADIQRLIDELLTNKLVQETLSHMAKLIGDTAEQKAARLATMALQETYLDRQISLDIEHYNVRGQPAVKFTLNHEGNSGDPLNTMGGTAVDVLSVIFRMVTILRNPKMARVLILDESTPHVSRGALEENFAKLLKRLARPVEQGGLGFKILLVTQSLVMPQFADRAYEFSLEDGRTVVKTIEEQ